MSDRNKESGALGSPSRAELQDSEEFPVGYRNPPEATRFEPGQSGNRRGRPRGAKNRKTIVKMVAMETNIVTEQGKRRRRTNLELVLIVLRNLAIEGNVSAVRVYQAYLEKFGPQLRIVRGMALMPAPMTVEEQIAEGERLNKLADARRREQLMERARRSAGQSPESGGPRGPAGARRLGPP